MKNLTSRSAARRWFIDGLALAGVVTAATFVMASSAAAQPQTHTVLIEVNAENCPINADPYQIKIKLLDKIELQAVTVTHDSKTGFATLTSHAKVSYRILFDPFMGTTIHSNPDGRAKSTPIRSDTPNDSVVFKYTIVSSNPDCDPYDPRMRVGK